MTGLMKLRVYLGLLSVAIFGSLSMPAPLLAQSFAENTQVAELGSGTWFGDVAPSISFGGYDLGDGSSTPDGDLGVGDWQDLQVTWVTQVHENVGVYWGFGTGERTTVQAADPNLRLGFVLSHDFSDRAQISFAATHRLGGASQPQPCTVGVVGPGGLSHVTCGMAANAAPLPLSLGGIFNESLLQQTQVVLRYGLRF